ADGAGGLVVEEGPPRAAIVVGPPDAAVADADVEHPGAVGDARRRLGAAPAVGADHPPAQLAEERGVVGLGPRDGGDPGKEDEDEGERGRPAHGHGEPPAAVHSSAGRRSNAYALHSPSWASTLNWVSSPRST